MKYVQSSNAQDSTNVVTSSLAGKNLLRTLIVMALAALLAVAAIGCSSPAPADSQSSAPSGAGQATPAEDTIKVNLIIDCSEAVEAGNATAIAASEDGIMFEGTLELEKGATIFDAIDASGINFTNTESSMGSYISAINGLASGDQGEMSGWIYTLNGESVMVSANEQELKEGDSVEWNFILEPTF